MVVINGLPYYQSTGQNSGSANTWFPFIMLRGNKAFHLPLDLPEPIRGDLRISELIKSENYLIKYAPKLEHEGLKEFHWEGRIPTKQTLIVSYQLNPASFTKKSLIKYGQLSDSELFEAETPLDIQTNDIEVIEDTDEVNRWLMKQGAQIATTALSDEFANQLRAKFLYYYECAEIFNTEGFETRGAVYQSLGEILENAHNSYLDLDAKDRPNYRQACLDNIASEVQKLETQEIKQGRNIIVQVMNWHKIFAVRWELKPESQDTSNAGNRYLFHGTPTQTVKDSSEEVRLSTNSTNNDESIISSLEI